MLKHAHILNHFRKADSKIYEFMKTVDFEKWFNPRKKLEAQDNYFVALCREIIGQQLSGKAANSIFTRFLALFDTENIEPGQILALDKETLRGVGLSWAKVKYIQDLAQKVQDKELNLQDLPTAPDDEVIQQLTKVKGIGLWTAEMFLIFTLQRENTFSHGDLALNKAIKNIYGLKTIDKKRVEKIVKKWEPYKTYGSITLWNSLDNL